MRDSINRTYLSEEETFENVFKMYFPKIKSFAYKILKSEAESEDLAQDIFMRLWHNREVFNEIKSFDHYLYKMARNLIYNRIEHKYVERTHRETLDQEPESANNVYDWIYAKEVEELIQQSVEKMPPQRKKIFLMSRQEGLSNSQIAEKLNISRRTVDCHLTLALAELKKITYLLLFFIFG